MWDIKVAMGSVYEAKEHLDLHCAETYSSERESATDDVGAFQMLTPWQM